MPRVWTVDEANAVLPQLREILTVLIEQKSRAELAQASLQELEMQRRGNGHDLEPELEFRRRRLREAVAQVRQSIEQVANMGCEVKDLDTGLVDFPSVRDGREVLLCWQMSEPRVMYWHDPESGFAGRKPL